MKNLTYCGCKEMSTAGNCYAHPWSGMDLGSVYERTLSLGEVSELIELAIKHRYCASGYCGCGMDLPRGNVGVTYWKEHIRTVLTTHALAPSHQERSEP